MIDINAQIERVSNSGGDIYQHIPTLMKYAAQCQHITELGVRFGDSTWAWVSGKPKRLFCVDFDPNVSVPDIQQACLENGIDFKLVCMDSSAVEIEETDLLFIDTLHAEHKAASELAIHGSKVRKFIVLHDTETFGEVGDDGVRGGLRLAIATFLLNQNGAWMVKEHFHNNNGLTVLQRV